MAITSISGCIFTISEQCPYVLTRPPHGESEQKGEGEGRPYRDFKINKLLGKCAHIVIKAESVLARLFRGEDEVALSLLLRAHDDLVAGTDDAVVHIERATRLNLLKSMYQSLNFIDFSLVERTGLAREFYGKVEGQFCTLFLHIAEEASFLVGTELVGEGRSRN